MMGRPLPGGENMLEINECLKLYYLCQAHQPKSESPGHVKLLAGILRHLDPLLDGVTEEEEGSAGHAVGRQ